MKDARGHGSNARGGSFGGYDNDLGYMHQSNQGPGAPHAQDRAAAAAISTGHPKQGLVGIHSASRVTKAVRAVRLAFRKGM